MMPSKGFKFSIPMLLIMLLEIMVLVDVSPQHINTPVLIFFAIEIATFLVQLAGILLVAAGSYRVGGILQIAASAIHVLDVTGIIGIIGGMKAYRYPEHLAELERQKPGVRVTS